MKVFIGKKLISERKYAYCYSKTYMCTVKNACFINDISFTVKLSLWFPFFTPSLAAKITMHNALAMKIYLILLRKFYFCLCWGLLPLRNIKREDIKRILQYLNSKKNVSPWVVIGILEIFRHLGTRLRAFNPRDMPYEFEVCNISKNCPRCSEWFLDWQFTFR